MTTNAQALKKSLPRVTTAVMFKKNLGTTLDDAQDVTEYVVKLGDLSEKLSKSSVNSGGVLLPSMKLKLDNRFGKWNKRSDFFKAGFVNGSEFTITANYLDDDDVAITPAFIYKGIIKYTSCEWSRDQFLFEVVLVPASSFLTSEIIGAGTLTRKATFREVCFKILNRAPFNKYLTIDISNFEMGWDVDEIDSIADMTNKKVKEVLDKIMLLTGSVYYVNYSGAFIIEPVEPSSPSAVCTLRGDDIYKVNSEAYDWDSQYTGIVWDDDENTVIRSVMDYPTREIYQYDYRQLTLDNKYITDATKRKTITDNLLELYKFIKRRNSLTCKWNPEIIVNEYIALDVPEEAITGDEFLTFNSGDEWNAGLYWGIKQPGISFDSSDLWRVADIKRSTDGEKMTIEVIQLNSDDEV